MFVEDIIKRGGDGGFFRFGVLWICVLVEEVVAHDADVHHVNSAVHVYVAAGVET